MSCSLQSALQCDSKLATGLAAGNWATVCADVTRELATVMAAGNYYRGHILRPIVAAANFDPFSIFRPFFKFSGRFWRPLYGCFLVVIALQTIVLVTSNCLSVQFSK
jgi:hypothetical protein